MDSSLVASTIVDAYRQLHRDLREEIAGLDEAALNWVPGPETNSIATLVTHLLGSEIAVITVLSGHKSDRDRPKEFTAGRQDERQLLERSDAADRILDKYGGAIAEVELIEIKEIPGRDPHTGLYWLISNYAHAREHLAQLQLTKQLYLLQEGG